MKRSRFDLITILAVVSLAALTAGSHTNLFRNAVNERLPVSMHIERARLLLESLEDDIHRDMTAVARREKQLQRLTLQTAQIENSLDALSGSDHAKQVSDDLIAVQARHAADLEKLKRRLNAQLAERQLIRLKLAQLESRDILAGELTSDTDTAQTLAELRNVLSHVEVRVAVSERLAEMESADSATLQITGVTR